MFIPLLGYLDIPSIIIGLVVLYVIYGILNRGRANVYTGLRLTKYVIDENNSTQLVSIEGQKDGIIATLLSSIGFGNFYEIQMTNRFVYIQARNKTDEGNISLPITGITGVFYGFERPRLPLYIGIALIIIGIAPLFGGRFGGGIGLVELIIMLLGGAVIYFMYWKNQSIEVRVTCGDGVWFGYAFRAGSEGTLEKARATALLVQKFIYTTTAQQQ